MSWSLIVAATIAHGAETFEGYTYYLGDPHLHTGTSKDGLSADIGDPGDAINDIGSLEGTEHRNLYFFDDNS